jgi:alpha-N-arabinofuranosidase
MFSTQHGDEILATDAQNIPTRAWQRRGRGGTAAPAQQIREVFFDATRDSKSGLIYLKVVNCSGSARPITVKLSGVKSVSAKGEAVVLAADSLDATNSLTEPNKVVPRMEKLDGLGTNFTREFAPYSIAILKLRST